MVMATVFWAKVAVMVPAALIVACVEARFALANVTEFEGVALHDVKAYPFAAVAPIVTGEPTVYDWVPLGLVVEPDPPPLVAKVIET
jgi:hypothetical protein